MKIEVNIEKKHMFLILGTLLLIAGVVLVQGYNDPIIPANNPAIIGHSVDEMDWSQTIPQEISVEDVFLTSVQKKASEVGVECNWIGPKDLGPLFPPEYGITPWFNIGRETCVNDRLESIKMNEWSQGSCGNMHAKGYHCDLTITDAATAAYDLHCYTTLEHHGEWIGTITGVTEEVFIYRNNQNPTGSPQIVYSPEGLGLNGDDGSARIVYDPQTGEWDLRSRGKENNQNSPAWSIKSCLAGGYGPNGFSPP